jgi:flavorubredoxin/flavin reductase (DIM6/NTAB) family NADH-FMN oxidoreductase RutF
MNVALEQPKTQRLSMQVATVAAETTAIRSLDWDRDRFDIEFGLRNGTTYNSFLVRGDRVALVDASHRKFHDLYLACLQEQIDPTQMDYLVISHTEPDHSGLVPEVLALAPQATVVGTKVALQFLADLIHQPFAQKVVKNGDQLDLGQGHILQFINAPNLHWPDTMATYDRKTQVLFTCDIFGMHYCSDRLYDEVLADIAPDYRFYYDCLMAPNARSVLSAMKRMDELPPPVLVANGHGPLLKHHAAQLMQNYRTWSESQTKGETLATVFYTAEYGFSDRLSQAVARGIAKTGVAVEMMDLRSADLQEIREQVGRSSALAIAMPPAGTPAETAVTAILGSAHSKQTVGFFESYGGDDLPIDVLANRFRDLGLPLAFPLIRIQDTPSEALYQLCDEAGTDLGQRLTVKKTVAQMKSLDVDLDRAMGRLAGGLYVLTAVQGARKGAMLASWVAQASFKPLGISVAVAKDRAIETLMQVGDRFVLNVLAEGNASGLMQHFLKRFAPGADRFVGVKTQTLASGQLVLSEALSYIECEVSQRLEANDHWIVYAVAVDGKVANPDGLTATHHRKVGNHY